MATMMTVMMIMMLVFLEAIFSVLLKLFELHFLIYMFRVIYQEVRYCIALHIVGVCHAPTAATFGGICILEFYIWYFFLFIYIYCAPGFSSVQLQWLRSGARKLLRPYIARLLIAKLQSND